MVRREKGEERGGGKRKKKGHIPPHVFFDTKACEVTSPVASCPTRALVQELHPILQRGFEFTLVVVLNPSLPLVAHEPACDKVVVVSVQDVLSPPFALETIQELGAFQDLGPVRPGSA